jgi:Luciferase-like monooxygenase
MKFALFILPTIPGTLAERRELRPIGRNRERYQQMLKEVRDIAVLADNVGIDLLCTTEHHFHSEGFEVSVAPLLLYADLAARTKRLKFAPLSLVIPAWDPIRLAEETAVLDHLTGGRFCIGLARGYQDRWVNVLGQHYGVKGAPMDGSADDLANRDVFEELIEVVKKAWTQALAAMGDDQGIRRTGRARREQCGAQHLRSSGAISAAISTDFSIVLNESEDDRIRREELYSSLYIKVLPARLRSSLRPLPGGCREEWTEAPTR